MLATRIRQKDGIFYFVSYPAADVLNKVRFISRFYGEGEQIAPQTIPQHDEIAQFISRIERTDEAFQRQLSRAKVRALKNFYEMAAGAAADTGDGAAVHRRTAAVPGRRRRTRTSATCRTPAAKFLIIDGQHRLAALHFYLKERPAEGRNIQVPCVIFDGRSEDFAAEMFVIINSTPTRINKSHLVDLYERVSWADPDRRFAARMVEDLYSEGDSPLRYRINRLGGRSQQDKWILQAELFNELHRWVSGDWKKIRQAHQHLPRGGALLRHRARLLQGRAARLGRRLGPRRLHGDQARHAEGDGAGVRRSRPQRRRARPRAA